MAQEDDLDLDIDGVAEEEAPKSKSKLIIIIVIVVLLLGVSAVATLMLTGMLGGEEEEVVAEETESKGGDKKSKEKKAKKTKAPLNYVPLDPPFVVNFSGDTDIRFLQVTIEVGTRQPEVIELVKEHRPAIRNSLVMLFSSQDPYTLNTREGKEELRGQALTEIQRVMKEETGEKGVENVFFTSFVMQ